MSKPHTVGQIYPQALPSLQLHSPTMSVSVDLIKQERTQASCIPRSVLECMRASKPARGRAALEPSACRQVTYQRFLIDCWIVSPAVPVYEIPNHTSEQSESEYLSTPRAARAHGHQQASKQHQQACMRQLTTPPRHSRTCREVCVNVRRALARSLRC